MTTLSDIKKAIQLRLRSQSIEALRGVETAAKCVQHLMDQGCTVQQITIRPDYVVIDIDQPSDWLKGSIHITRINGRYREIIKVTKVLECQVQWIEREAHPRLQREG